MSSGRALRFSNPFTINNITIHNETGNYVVDFGLADQTMDFINLVGDVTFTFINYTPGRVYGLRLLANGADRTITLPDAVWLTAKPTSVANGKFVVITIESLGSSLSHTLADWKSQP
jgi:hypothetical protein